MISASLHSLISAMLMRMPGVVVRYHSGWWGLARKINYTGDWLITLSWCLLCGFKVRSTTHHSTGLSHFPCPHRGPPPHLAPQTSHTSCLLLCLCLCLCVCVGQSPVPYFQALYFLVLLVHRAIRDDHMCREKVRPGSSPPPLSLYLPLSPPFAHTCAAKRCITRGQTQCHRCYYVLASPMSRRFLTFPPPPHVYSRHGLWAVRCRLGRVQEGRAVPLRALRHLMRGPCTSFKKCQDAGG